MNNWMGALGVSPQIKTPNLDQLAQEGMLFHNAHDNFTRCFQSRASFMSGLWPKTIGAGDELKGAEAVIARARELGAHRWCASLSLDPFGGCRVRACR